jgi:hypothetical protein
METWPSTIQKADVGTDEEYYKPQDSTEFEANYIQVRPQALRGRLNLPGHGWSRMTESEFQILQSFFDANQGATFTYTHPITGVAHTCVFMCDRIKSKWGKPGWRTDIQCPIAEL